ncbi:DUF1090 family protein [Pseudomonas pergaminensis]|uniref:DUF1090 family protein n=1 Tax=Pseudomonas pergaminensis TaxID=2853159 RepID=UPI0034D75FF1
MRLSKLAPSTALFSLIALSAQAADLSALTGALSSALGGANNTTNNTNYSNNASSCQQQVRDLQANINAANAKGDTLRATAYQAALTQTNKSCSNASYNTQAQVNTDPQHQQNVNKAADAINAIGGLFK